MASSNAVWGIDIGQCALKALKLRPAGDGKVEAVAFDVIEHPKILSQPDADRDELIGSALEKFASRNEWQGDRFVVGVPGQQTFARFCKMPPIDLKKDAKKIPELVRYEASQQIPFDMDDVVWDYQVFTTEGSPDIEVGIFAIRKDLIRKHLGFFSKVGIAPTGVQAIPAALYNFCRFDRGSDGDAGATVMVDVGSQNTDLIIVEPNSAWTRNIPLGGNSFTEALVRTFKLSFAKAESLKRSAATSKYARQIFQAMRPVFADLVAEIQRSIGFYSSTHRDVELKRVLALGNAFRLPGLQKYLENNLTVGGGVSKLEKLNQVVASATINAPQFTENVLSFGAAYGLALQGLGMARIHASLLPPEMARIAVWRKKRPYFMATAAALALASAVPWGANYLAAQELENEQSKTARAKAASVVAEARKLKDEFSKAKSDTGQREQDIQSLFKLQKDRLVLAEVLAMINAAMPPLNPPDLNEVTTVEELKKKIESAPEKYKRTERGQLLIEAFKVDYTPDVEAVKLMEERPAGGAMSPGAGPMGGGAPGFGGAPGMGAPGMTGMPMASPRPQAAAAATAATNPGFIVRIQGRLLYRDRQSTASRWLASDFYNRLREESRVQGRGFYIPEDDPTDATKRYISEPIIRKYYAVQGGSATPTLVQPGLGTGTADKTILFADPATGEDAKDDWQVDFTFKLRLGEMPPVKPADKK